MRPCAACAARTTRAGASGSATSSAIGCTSPSIPCAAASPFARSREPSRTVYPRAASCRPVSRPRPRLAPVTSATRRPDGSFRFRPTMAAPPYIFDDPRGGARRTSMKIVDLFKAQLEREAAISRRLLEKAPVGKPDWKPHEKSMPLGYLAHLVAAMPSWIAMTVLQDSLDIGAGGPPATWSSTRELVDAADKAVSSGRDALAGTSDEHLMTSWRLEVGGRTVMEAPRHVVIEDTFTHLAHHRGQLSVYLRLNGAALPSIYGPTADERTFG